jgi:hypothetical protein
VDIWQSARDTGDRLTQKPDIYFNIYPLGDSQVNLTVNTTQKFQQVPFSCFLSFFIAHHLSYLFFFSSLLQILGFGGAFTEASAYVFSLLNETNQQWILDSYFSPNGNRYNVGKNQTKKKKF